MRIDASSDVAKGIWPGSKRHNDFFHGGITRALTQAVDGHFNLSRPGLDGRERVSGAHTQIVVAVGAHDYIIDTWDAFAQVTEKRLVFMRQGVADGIGNIDGCSASPDRCFTDAAEVVPLATSGILR